MTVTWLSDEADLEEDQKRAAQAASETNKSRKRLQTALRPVEPLPVVTTGQGHTEPGHTGQVGNLQAAPGGNEQGQGEGRHPGGVAGQTGGGRGQGRVVDAGGGEVPPGRQIDPFAPKQQNQTGGQANRNQPQVNMFNI